MVFQKLNKSFTPLGSTRQSSNWRTVSDRMWADEQEKKALTTGLGKAFAQAQEVQDVSGMSRLQTRVFVSWAGL
jgi:hypothetical protein